MTGDCRRSVLITRPEPGASETAARLRALGLEPVLAPLLRVQALPARWPAAAGFQAILVTSGNAIPMLAALDRSRPLLAVGDATAERAREAGFAMAESADGDATDLAELTRRRLDPAAGPLLLACGQGHGRKLAAGLRGQGFRVLRRTVYAATPVRVLPDAAVDALRANRLRAALFFSADTARRFVTLMQGTALRNSLCEVVALAISAPVGVALSPLSWGDLSIAARPNQDELLALLS